jgi:hypothetical protein
MTTLLSNQAAPATMSLAAGRQLTVALASGSTALVERYQGDALLDKTPIAAGITHVFGEYLINVSMKITCLTGSLTYSESQNTGNVVQRATQTNDDAAAGEIGEYKETVVAIGDAVPETTATPVDVCTLALTAGDWEVSGTVNRSLTGVTATQYTAAISPTADTVPAQTGGSGVGADSSVTQDANFGATVTGNYVTTVGPARVKLAAAATIHLVAADTFSAGTIGLFGTLRARRVR